MLAAFDVSKMSLASYDYELWELTYHGISYENHTWPRPKSYLVGSDVNSETNRVGL